MGEANPVGQPVPAVLLRSDTARLVLRYVLPIGVASGVVPLPVLWASRDPGDTVDSFIAIAALLLTVVGLCGVVACWWFAGNAVSIQPEGVEAFRRGRPAGHYRWSDIEWCSWRDERHLSRYAYGASGVVVAPSGSPYAVPGPNNPVVLGSILLFTRAQRRYARAALARAATAAGVEVR